MSLTKKQLEEINKRALNKVARSNKSALPQNNPTTNIADETLRRNTLQLNQTQVEPLPFVQNNPFSQNNLLASYQAFKQQPQFNEVQKFELRNNNSYKDLITRADNLRTQANDRLSQARNYIGVHKDLYGNDVQINTLKDYVSYLKNTNDPLGDNQEYINKLYKDEQDALRFADQSNRQADEIEKIAEAKIKSEAADYTASGSDLAFKKQRMDNAISNMPFNSEARNDIARDYRKEYQDVTNYKIQEDMWNNVPQDLRNSVQNAVTNNDTDTASKLLKNNGYDDNAIKSIINKAEINRDKNIATKEENETKEYARNNPVLASLKSIGNSVNPINNLEAVKELLGYRLGRAIRTTDEPVAETFNQYNEAQRKVNEKAILQNEVSNNINNPLLKSGYDIGMSTVDNLVRMGQSAALDRVLPGSGNFFNGMLASLDVAANEIRNGEERGLNTAQITSTALANAINEQVFETLSFDKIIKNADKPVAGLKDFFKKLISKDTLVNMGIEGSEEAFTDLGNMAADKLLNGSENELEQNYIKLINSGMSDEEAKKQVMLDKAKSIAESFIAGAISAGLISAAVGGANYAKDRAVNKINENKILKNAGKNIIKAGNNQRVKNLVDNMQIEDEETQNIVNNTNWNDAQSVGRTVAQLIQYENNMVDNEVKNALSIELSKKLAENNVNSAQQVANMIVAGDDVSGIGDSNVDAVAKQYNEFMNGNINADNEYLNISNDNIATHSNNLATLARLTTERVQSANTENETTKEQKSLKKTQNKASQSIVGKNEKSYLLNNPNQKFDILTIAVDKNGQSKVIASGSHEQFNPDDVALDEKTAKLYEVGKKYSPKVRQAFFAGAEDGISSVENYAAAFDEAYKTGEKGLGLETAYKNATVTLDLNRDQVERAYNAGLDSYTQNAQIRTKELQKKNNTYTGTVDTSKIDTTKLNDVQKSAINVIKSIADNVGVDIELFESKADEQGSYRKKNGSYDPDTNKIEIDINAGLRVVGEKRNTMIVTLAHELTHSFEFNAPETYAQLQEYVFNNLTKSKGKTAEELIYKEMARLELRDEEKGLNKNTKEKYEEIAKSEIVARGCERILTDEAAIKELAYTNQGLFGKIKAWIEQLCENLRNAYADLFEDGKLKKGIVSDEAEALKDFENGLRTMWNNAAVEATKNTKKVVVAKNATGAKDSNVSAKNSEKLKKNFKNAKKEAKNIISDSIEATDNVYQEYAKKDEETAKRIALDLMQNIENISGLYTNEEIINDNDIRPEAYKEEFKRLYNMLSKNKDAITGSEYARIKENNNENNFYSFAGRESATADLEMLEKAQQMSKEHKFKQDILEQTGWFKGVDGKWRYEIDNSDFELKDNIDTEKSYYRLEDLIKDNKLFEAYRNLKNMQVTFEGLGKPLGAYYNASSGQLEHIKLNKIDFLDIKSTEEYLEELDNLRKELQTEENKLSDSDQADFFKLEYMNTAITEETKVYMNKTDEEKKKFEEEADKLIEKLKNNNKLKTFNKIRDLQEDIEYLEKNPRHSIAIKNKDNLISVLLHEIQHYIQEKEDFERGSNPEYWNYIVISNEMGLSPAENNLIHKREKEYRAFKNELDKKYGSDIIILEFYNNYKNMYETAILNGEENAELYKKYEKSLKDLMKIGGEEAVEDAEKEAKLWDLKEKYRKYAFERNSRESFDLYQNTVGEIEARDVQKRLDNKSLFPEVGSHSIGMVSSGRVQNISDEQVLFQERDYNVEYNKELYKKYRFDFNTLSDYDKDKEGVIRSLKINKKIQKEFINNKVEPIYKNKRLEYHVLDKNEVKDYILNNNIDLETLKTNKAIRSNLYKIINNIIDSQKIAFCRKLYVEEYNEIKNAINGNVSDSNLVNDIKLINKPEQVIDQPAIYKKEEEYLKKNDNAFTKYVEKIVDRLLDASQNPKSEAQILAENLKTHKSPYQELRTKVRNGWTIDKIQRELKKESSSVISKREISKFKNIEEILENVFYHGSISANSRLKAGSTLRPEQRTGGYGQAYHSISLSKDKDIASIFASTGNSGNVIPVILKKGAVVVDMKNIEDSIELEEILPELWNKQIDAVKIGDWNKKIGTEKEIVILNPKAIMTIPQGIEYFKNTNKPKFKNLTKNELKDLIKKSTDSDVRYQERYNEALENENLEEVEKIVEDYAATKGFNSNDMNSGYSGYSMSNRAVQAYEQGEKPISKWTKTAMMDRLKELDVSEEKINLIKKYPVKVLKDTILKNSSWHHTSSKLNKTYFYDIDMDVVNSKDLQNILENSKKSIENTVKDENDGRKIKGVFKEYGKNNYGKTVYIGEETLEGIKKGDWLVTTKGEKRKLSANKTISWEYIDEKAKQEKAKKVDNDKILKNFAKKIRSYGKKEFNQDWYIKTYSKEGEFIHAFDDSDLEEKNVYGHIEHAYNFNIQAKVDYLVANNRNVELSIKENADNWSESVYQLKVDDKTYNTTGRIGYDYEDSTYKDRMQSQLNQFLKDEINEIDFTKWVIKELKDAGLDIKFNENVYNNNKEELFQDRYEEKLYKKALAENENYKKLIAQLQRQLELNPYKNLSDADAMKLTNIVVKNTETSMPVKEIRDKIKKAFSLSSTEPLQQEKDLRMLLRPMILEAIDRHENTAKNRSDYANQILSNLRKTRIKLSDTQKQEAAYLYGTYNDWQKHMMGKIIISNNGTDLDKVWTELSSLYPDVFDSEITDAEQPGMLENIINNLKEDYVSDFGLNRRDFADYITTEILTEYVGLKPQKTLAQIKKDYKEEMQEYKKRVREKTRRMRQELREERKEHRKEISILTKNAKISVRAENQIQRDKEAARHAILRDARWLNTRFLRPNGKNHIQEDVRKPVALFLDAFSENTKVFGNDDLDALKITNTALKNSENEYYANKSREGMYAYIEGIAEELSDSIIGRRLSQLDLQELESLADLLHTFRTLVENETEVFVNGKKRDVQVDGWMLADDLKKNKPYKSIRFRPAQNARDLIFNNSLKPVYFFRHLGRRAEGLFKHLLEGQDKFAKNLVKARDFVLSAKDTYNYDKWDKDATVKIGDIELTVEQALSVYASYKRQTQNMEQEAKHLFVGGIILDSKMNKILKDNGQEKDSKIFQMAQRQSEKIGEAEMMQIVNFLTDEQMRYADHMVGYLSNDMAELGNEVSLRMDGWKKFNETYYFPYRSSRDVLSTDTNEKNQGTPSIKNMGFTKALSKRANNTIVISDFTDTCARHINGMLKYNALAEPEDYMNRVFSYTEKKYDEADNVKEYGDNNLTLLKHYFGDGAVAYYNQFKQNLDTGLVKDPNETLYSSFLSLFKKNAVLGNLSVMIQQPSAIVRAMAYIEPKYFIKTAKNNHFSKKKWEEIKKYSGVAILKEIGGWDVSTGRGLEDYITEKQPEGIRRVLDPLDDALGRMPGKMDEITWCHIWDACKAKIKANTTTTSTEEINKRTAELFDEVINNTQVYDSTLSRSNLINSKSLFMQMATAFKSEPTTSWNMYLEAVREAGKGNKRKASKLIGSVIGSVALNSLLVAIIRGMRNDKDKDKSYLEKYVKAVADNFTNDINPLSMLPFTSELLNLLKGYEVKRNDTEVIYNTYKSIADGLQSDNPKDMILNVASGIGTITGVPIANIIRDIKGIINLSLDMLNNNMLPDNFEEVLEAVEEGITDKKVKIQDRVEKYVKSNNEKDLQKIKEELELSIKELHPEYSKDRLKKEVDNRLKARMTQALKSAYVNGSTKEKEKIVEKMKKLNVYKSTNLKDFGKDTSKKVADSWIIQDLKEQYKNADRKNRIEIRKKLYATGHWKKLADLDKQLKKWQ